MINISDKKNCNGCCACFDICPVNAIKMVTDPEGFWYPEVDFEKCTRCTKCINVCPEINYPKIKNRDNIEPACFVVNNKNLEVRKDSTSGGVFSAFADYFYEINGSVSGAVYNDDFSVRHIVSQDSNDLKNLRSSKYLQSDLSGIYKEISKKLNDDKNVLVCGCPCQMAALRLFLGKDYDNLLICDFICKGINSPKIFRKHLDSLEKEFNSDIEYIKAKSKEFGWRSLTLKVEFKNKKIYYGDGHYDNFMRGYLSSGYFCRPSCYECNFKTLPRYADITLGDFWGVEKISPDLDDNLGTSAVICNTLKGLNFFWSINNRFLYHKIKIGDIYIGNKHLFDSLKTDTRKRKLFFSNIDKYTFPEISEKFFPLKTKYNKWRKLLNFVKILTKKWR